MADTDKLRSYKPVTPPTIADDYRRDIVTELRRVEQSIESIAGVMKALEARIAALGG